ncbi:LuxR family transcriptional regulator [Rhodobacteraceae bacterium B1Z28]|uniref:LuxR family transcriptional regulator n=1 Tax=Ruegeria haliotis TaxID=2747601 RepID=A0ABX2PWC9_9RHOB|nr:LuxR family transcriptional regulator [Ruegeria haliotis]NVO58509.1 LuxR family transcriptional regulator [Ruegeria haliotis]
MDLWAAPSEYDAQDGAEKITPRMCSMVGDLGLEHFSFIVLKSAQDDLTPLAHTLFTSYPKEWVDRYTRHKYWDVDPVTDLGHRSIRPFFWGHGPFLRAFAKKQRVVFDEADAFDIRYGLTIPIRGAQGELSVFTVVSSRKAHLEEVMQGATGRVYSAAVDTHELALKELAKQRWRAQNAVELSEREKECLSWTLEGKTAGEIATILGISTSTINQHASSAAGKLGSLNKHHAAVQALRLKLIQ